MPQEPTNSQLSNAIDQTSHTGVGALGMVPDVPATGGGGSHAAGPFAGAGTPAGDTSGSVSGMPVGAPIGTNSLSGEGMSGQATQGPGAPADTPNPDNPSTAGSGSGQGIFEK